MVKVNQPYKWQNYGAIIHVMRLYLDSLLLLHRLAPVPNGRLLLRYRPHFNILARNVGKTHLRPECSETVPSPERR